VTVGETRKGKIARLPRTIRDEVCRRLDDGETAATILPWLNELPQVKTVLGREFAGAEISPQNLSEWRNGGFEDWLRDQERVANVGRLADLAARLAKASGGNIGEGAVAVAAGKILEQLETASDADVREIAKALVGVRAVEIESKKLDNDRRKIGQKDREIALAEQRFRRQTAELFLAWLDDRRAREIAEGKGTREFKIQQLIPLFFGERLPAPAPTSGAPPAEGPPA
jgi:hypothetical protein